MGKLRLPHTGLPVPEEEQAAPDLSMSPWMSLLSDVLAAEGGAAAFAGKSGGIWNGLGHASGVLSLMGVAASAQDIDQKGANGQNVADLGFNGLGAASWLASLVGAAATAKVTAAAAGGYSAGKLGDASVGWLAPGGQGITDRMAERGAAADREFEDAMGGVMGEEAADIGGDVLGGLSMGAQIINPFSWLGHAQDALGERIVHWWESDDDEDLEEIDALEMAPFEEEPASVWDSYPSVTIPYEEQPGPLETGFEALSAATSSGAGALTETLGGWLSEGGAAASELVSEGSERLDPERSPVADVADEVADKVKSVGGSLGDWLGW
jgi:hypothetical protein